MFYINAREDTTCSEDDCESGIFAGFIVFYVLFGSVLFFILCAFLRLCCLATYSRQAEPELQIPLPQIPMPPLGPVFAPGSMPVFTPAFAPGDIPSRSPSRSPPRSPRRWRPRPRSTVQSVAQPPPLALRVHIRSASGNRLGTEWQTVNPPANGARSPGNNAPELQPVRMATYQTPDGVSSHSSSSWQSSSSWSRVARGAEDPEEDFDEGAEAESSTSQHDSPTFVSPPAYTASSTSHEGSAGFVPPPAYTPGI